MNVRIERFSPLIPWTTVAVSILLAVWLGQNVSRSPILVILIVVASGFLILSTLGRHVEQLFVVSLCLLLIGYMFQGRGFAYFGVSPLYVGEMVLAIGISALLFAKIQWRFSFLEFTLIAFIGLGVLRTLPSVRPNGLDAFRDAALWYYASFAILVAWILTESRLLSVVRLFGLLLPTLVIWIAVMSTAFRVLPESLPHFPGSPLPILSLMKPGDRAVVLVALAAFVISGLYARQQRMRRIPTMVFWSTWLLGAAIVAVENRGGLLAIATALFLVALLHPSREWLKMGSLGAAVLALVLVVDPTINVGSSRQFSVEQLTENVTTIFSNDESAERELQGTKNWRVNFWTAIYEDTVQGPNFWSGTGFGQNLANEYGFQASADESLRSPHNSFVTVLARLGVPGAALWMALQIGFGTKMLLAFQAARRSGQTYWSSVIVWLIAIWLAALVNSMFDVYLEGPQGAIPFWCVFGAGIAAMRFQRHAMARERSAPRVTPGDLSAYPARP
jgi:hypothetical protein